MKWLADIPYYSSPKTIIADSKCGLIKKLKLIASDLSLTERQLVIQDKDVNSIKVYIVDLSYFGTRKMVERALREKIKGFGYDSYYWAVFAGLHNIKEYEFNMKQLAGSYNKY